ncbi:hypothetical protein FOCG_17127 [Fusarium oxysporum f. sp. radicis-lycopersici 26381]|nr:hypothetical protein FOCG_17127 [Fusarium oxysporum f. sp. radicis-lycopersici 26381]
MPGQEKLGKPAPRSRTGCLECRRRHIRCDEQQPKCGNCLRSRKHRVCEYPMPTLTLRDRRAQAKARRPWDQLTFAAAKTVTMSPETLPCDVIISDTFSTTSDPFDSLSINLSYQSKELLYHFYQSVERFDKVSQQKLAYRLSPVTGNSYALRSVMLFAALHYDWSTEEGMQAFESTFLHHKIKAIQAINGWIAGGHPQLITSIIRQIATLCFIELCLGSLASAKTHIDGMVVLLNQQRLRIHEQPDPYRFQDAEEYQQDEELTDRYFLLILSFYTRYTLHKEPYSGQKSGEDGTPAPASETTLSHPLNQIERNCDPSLKLLSLRTMLLFSKPVPPRATLSWINGRDTIERLKAITESLDMMYGKPHIDHDEVQFAMACTNCVASQIHLDQLASHIASFCYTKDELIRKETEVLEKLQEQELRTTWCGLYIASSIYIHRVLGLGEPEETMAHDYIIHVFKKALMKQFGRMGDGRSMSDQLLLWEMMLGAINVTVDSQGSDQQATKYFSQAIWQWSRTAQIRNWSDAKAILARIAWPEVNAMEDTARQIWERSCGETWY